MSIFDEGLSEAEKYAKDHPEQVDKAVDRGEGMVDDRTGHRYDKQVAEGGERLEERLTGDKAEGTQPPRP